MNVAPFNVSNPFGQSVDFPQNDIFTLAGFTMCGPGLGKAVRERFMALAAGLMRKHGLRAFEMPKRAAAIHEAGHVAINSVLGVRTGNALIDYITRDGKLYWVGFTDAPQLAFVDAPVSPVGFDAVLNRSRTTYAGIAAELLFAGDDRREGSSLDEIIMSQLLAEHAAVQIGIDAPTLWRDEVASWCNTQLHRNRKAHSEIADTLMKRGRLKGKVLRELCDKISAPDETFPDIQDHTSQLADARITPNDAEPWA